MVGVGIFTFCARAFVRTYAFSRADSLFFLGTFCFFFLIFVCFFIFFSRSFLWCAWEPKKRGHKVSGNYWCQQHSSMAGLFGVDMYLVLCSVLMDPYCCSYVCHDVKSKHNMEHATSRNALFFLGISGLIIIDPSTRKTRTSLILSSSVGQRSRSSC